MVSLLLNTLILLSLLLFNQAEKMNPGKSFRRKLEKTFFTTFFLFQIGLFSAIEGLRIASFFDIGSAILHLALTSFGCINALYGVITLWLDYKSYRNEKRQERISAAALQKYAERRQTMSETALQNYIERTKTTYQQYNEKQSPPEPEPASGSQEI